MSNEVGRGGMNMSNIKNIVDHTESVRCYDCRKSNLTFKKINSMDGYSVEVDAMCKSCGMNRTISMYLGPMKYVKL